MKRGVFKIALLMAFLIWLIVGFAALWGRGGIHEILKAKEKELELKEEIVLLKEEKIKLEKEIETLKNNPQAYEVYAREKLFMKKPNEVVIYLPPDDTKNRGK